MLAEAVHSVVDIANQVSSTNFQRHGRLIEAVFPATSNLDVAGVSDGSD
jgi:hypothetical protein